MSSLQGKAAIVTGSSRGIGRGIAERFGRDRANAVVTYAGNRDKAEAVMQAIELSGSKAIAIQVDVRKLEDVRALFEKAIRFSRLSDGMVLIRASFKVSRQLEGKS